MVVFLSAVSLLSKLLGFVREQIIAGAFGVSSITDAYYAAQLFPSFLDGVVGLAVGTALLPVFTAADSEGPDELGSVLLTCSILLVALFGIESIALWALAPWLITGFVSGLDASSQEQAIQLVRLFAPSVFVMGLSLALTALLNAKQRFILPAVTAVAANVSIIVVAAVYRSKVSVEHLAWAIVIGNLIQLIWLVLHLIRQKMIRRIYPVRPDVMRKAVLLSAPLILANALTQFTTAIDKAYASHLNPGSISALNYALKLAQLPVGVLVMGLSSVLYTRFSRNLANGDYDSVRHELVRSLQWLTFVIGPVAALIIGLAEPLVTVAFMRGSFGVEAVRATAGALRFYGIGLIPMMISPLVSRVLFSMHDTTSQLFAGFLAIGVYLLSATLLVDHMGHSALALSYALAQAGALILLGFALRRRMGINPFSLMLPSLLRILVASLATFGVAWLVSSLILGQVLSLVVGGMCGLLVYSGSHGILRTNEYVDLISWLRTKSFAIKSHGR